MSRMEGPPIYCDSCGKVGPDTRRFGWKPFYGDRGPQVLIVSLYDHCKECLRPDIEYIEPSPPTYVGSDGITYNNICQVP